MIKLKQTQKWLALLIVVTGLAVSTVPVFQADEPDFRRYHGWVWYVLPLLLILFSGSILWMFYKIFPSVLHSSRFVSGILATLFFVGSVFGLWGIVLQMNQIGIHPPEDVSGTLTGYSAAPRTNNASTTGRYGVVRLDNGLEVEVALSVIQNRKFKVGDQISFSYFRGNVFDWGWIK